MKAIVLDGTPEEVAETLKALGLERAAVVPTTPVEAPVAAEADDEEWHPMPTAIGRKMLSRRPLAGKPKSAILAIYNAGSEGILGSELCELLDYDQAQFRGMMGALGRRMTHTEGWEEKMTFFDYEWDPENGYRYKLPDTSRAAVEAELMD